MLVIVNVFADGIRHIRAQLLSSRPRRALGSARASQATKQRPSDNRCHGPSTLAKLMLSQKKKEIQYRSVNILECSHLPCFAVKWDGRTRQVLCDPRDRRNCGREEASGTQIGPSFILKDVSSRRPELSEEGARLLLGSTNAPTYFPCKSQNRDKGLGFIEVCQF